MRDVFIGNCKWLSSVLMALTCVCGRPALAAALAAETADAPTPAGELRLCELRISTEPQAYACREYHTANGSQIVLYQGGRVPRAVVHRRSHQQTPTVGAGAELPDRRSAPPGVPTQATHLGTGVCVDHDERLAPCEAYWHAPARDFQQTIFLVHYDPAGDGPVRIEATLVGTNQDALTAELAFQLGRALLPSACCRAQARAYLAYAYQQFPHEPDYFVAYRAALAETETDASRHADSAATVSPAATIGQAPEPVDGRF